MSARWKEIAQVRFTGDRFHDRALDAASLGEVQRFLRLVEETAKALWRTENPDRERLPAGFDESHRAFLRRLRRGSSVAVIESRIKESQQTEFLDRGAEEMLVAADFAHRAFDAVAKNRPLPERLPRELVSEYVDLGKSLGPGELLEVKAAGRKHFVAYRPEYRERLQRFALQPYEARLEQTGEIVEADVRQGRFQIWTDRNAAIPAPFKPEQEVSVTTALKEHRSVRVRVSGLAEFSADGKPMRFIEVADLVLLPVQEEYLFDPNAPAIEDEIEAIWKGLPEREWARLPADLSENLDHYLYGTPKR